MLQGRQAVAQVRAEREVGPHVSYPGGEVDGGRDAVDPEPGGRVRLVDDRGHPRDAVERRTSSAIAVAIDSIRSNERWSTTARTTSVIPR